MNGQCVTPAGAAIPPDVRQWAFVGDAVWHLFVRKHLVSDGWRKDLTRKAAAYVSAQAQAYAMEILLPLLSEDEADIYRRGKNGKYGVVPRNASPKQYHSATGMEALLGWLEEKQHISRMNELMELAYVALTQVQEETNHA